jgi:hypothetical protein
MPLPSLKKSRSEITRAERCSSARTNPSEHAEPFGANDPKRTRMPPLTSFAAWRAAVQTPTGNRTCTGRRSYRDFNNIRVRSFILTGAPALTADGQSEISFWGCTGLITTAWT